MNPSRLFIVRPVATALLMAAIMLVGAIGFFFLPLSALPEVDYPTIQVQTFLPGASPEVMTTSVTAPLERQFGQMPGLREMSSISSAFWRASPPSNSVIDARGTPSQLTSSTAELTSPLFKSATVVAPLIEMSSIPMPPSPRP